MEGDIAPHPPPPNHGTPLMRSLPVRTLSHTLTPYCSGACMSVMKTHALAARADLKPVKSGPNRLASASSIWPFGLEFGVVQEEGLRLRTVNCARWCT